MNKETAIRYFGEEWSKELKELLTSKYFERLETNILLERHNNYNKVLPPEGSGLIFKAFRVTPFSKVTVCILGMDPYSTRDAFDGLAFSNSTLNKPQPSLENILQEVKDDIYNVENTFASYITHKGKPRDINLYRWAEQGVLLINVAHTVLEGKPGSHIKYWEPFTRFVITKLNEKDLVVWLLFGNFSRSFKKYITNGKHLILETTHPSPFSAHRGFFGSKVFSKTNEYLKKNNLTEIIW